MLFCTNGLLRSTTKRIQLSSAYKYKVPTPHLRLKGQIGARSIVAWNKIMSTMGDKEVIIAPRPSNGIRWDSQFDSWRWLPDCYAQATNSSGNNESTLALKPLGYLRSQTEGTSGPTKWAQVWQKLSESSYYLM